jgi:glycosyltransferase involved in cell wall biosynthesis
MRRLRVVAAGPRHGAGPHRKALPLLPLRIVQLNLAWHGGLRDADELLDAYRTLTGWADALTSAGAKVHVVQRFRRDDRRRRGEVDYRFVADGDGGTPRAWTLLPRVVDAVLDASPDVVHVNGLMFPAMVQAIRHAAGSRTAIVLQDHSGAVPSIAPWPFARERIGAWRQAFAATDACSFTARELAARWSGLGIDATRIGEVPEASTRLRPCGRHVARERLGVGGDPVLLWVGRANANKDPLCVLDALEHALREASNARVLMVLADGPLQRRVTRRIEQSTILRQRTTTVGPVPHREMPLCYSASDVFVSGSHHEGSGYALIESLACGVVPCVTDIPAHRALIGACGATWPAGDAKACAAALRDLLAGDLQAARERARARFEQLLSWEAIGNRTHAWYASLLAERRTRG